MNKLKRVKQLIIIIIVTLFVVNLAIPIYANEKQKETKVVKVGWYESTYCYRDKFGRRSGIAYEYKQRIAAHTVLDRSDKAMYKRKNK